MIKANTPTNKSNGLNTSIAPAAINKLLPLPIGRNDINTTKIAAK